MRARRLSQLGDKNHVMVSWLDPNSTVGNFGMQLGSDWAIITPQGDTSGLEGCFFRVATSDVINLPVTVNGVRGTFVLDTGATFVSLKNSFAQKTGVEIDEASVIHLHTANGITEGNRGRAERIQLRSLVAKDVPIVVHSTGAYGEGIDGLLGMSFLSRFNIKIDTRSVNISTRKAP